jgi:hypothetical protein
VIRAALLLALASCGAPTPTPQPLTFTTGERPLDLPPVVELVLAPSDRAMPTVAWRTPDAVGLRALHSRLSTLGPPLALPAAAGVDVSRLAGGAVLAVVDAAGLTLHRVDGRGEPMQAPLSIAADATAAALVGLSSGAVRAVWVDGGGALRGLSLRSMVGAEAEPALLASGPAASPAVAASSDGGAWVAWAEAGALKVARWRDAEATLIPELTGSIHGAPSLVEGAVAWSDGAACFVATPSNPAVRLDTAGCGHVRLAAAGTSLFVAWEERTSPPSIRLQQRGLDLVPVGEPLTPPAPEPPASHSLPAVAAWTTRDGVEGAIAWAADGVPRLRGWRLGGEPRVDAPEVPPPPLPQPGPRP